MKQNTQHPKETTMDTTTSKINASDVKVGDLIASQKKGPYRTVTELNPGDTAVRIMFDQGGNIRPRFTTEVWREQATGATEAETPEAATEAAPEAGTEAETTEDTSVARVPASDLKVGDVIGTTGQNTRAFVEGDKGHTIAALTQSDHGNRVQARAADGKVIRSMAQDTQVWRKGQGAAPAKPTKPAKASQPKATKTASNGFQWPVDPQELVMEYLTSQVTDAADAPNKAKPFIDQRGVLRLHSSDWMTWLEGKGINAPKGTAAAPLRALGLGVRTFNLPGEDRALGFYTGPAPKGTEGLPRRASATRKPRATRPFGALSADQTLALYCALTAYDFSPEQEAHLATARDELLAALPE